MALTQIWTAVFLLAALSQEPDPHAHHQPAPTVVEGGWVKYQHKTAQFSLEHPADWSVHEENPVSIHIAHPSKPVHLYVAAFRMPQGTLKDFAQQKFGVQAEIFKPLGDARALDGSGWSGLVQEAEASRGTDRVRRRILCARHGDLYVSLALYMDPTQLAAPGEDYERLFTSLHFDAAEAPPRSSPAQPR
jgi:hypothetical protein